MVVCESAFAPVPDVAVTVTVLVPAGVPRLLGGLEALPPPHPIAIPPMPSNSVRHRSAGNRFFLRKKSRPSARTVPPPANGHVIRFSLVAAVVAMVIVVVTAVVPLGVTVAGEKLQVASAGRPEQAKVTAALKPLTGVTDRPTVPLLPGMTERLDGWAASVNVGAAFTVSVMAEETDGAKFVSPEYWAVIEWVPTLNVLVEYVATPELFSVPVPRVLVPSRNMTVPVGAVVLPEGPATVAVNVTFCPAFAVAAEVASVVAVLAATGCAFTTSVTADEVLPE